ncbi:ATP synthase F1 subunit delta [Humidisolicoccus flavus]|uniref:ATP synthase F1 subunit delta n=1 Tax=Humidisolicoccus flavus TaxID=3111414 RepID=UPI003246609D
MGSATKRSEAKAIDAFARLDSVTSETGSELLQLSQFLDANPQVVSALNDAGIQADDRAALADRLFASLGEPSRLALRQAVQGSWSNEREFVDVIERLGLRALIQHSGAPVGAEVFAFARLMQSNHELELALSDKLADPARKSELLNRLLGNSVAPATLEILRHLVSRESKTRLRKRLETVVAFASEVHGNRSATVTTATPLTEQQRSVIAGSIRASHGVDVDLHEIVDASVLGGVRILLGSEVIDGSVAARLAGLRRELVGAH